MIVDNVVYGAPPPIPTPNESCGWVLYKQLIKYANDKQAFVSEATEKYLSYKQLLQISCSLAEALRKSGLTSEDVAAVCSENNIYFCVAILAGLFTGLPITTINPVYTETELKHALDLTQPTIVFCSKTYYEKCMKLKTKHDCIRRIIVIDSYRNLPSGVSLMDFLRGSDTLYTNIQTFSPTTLDSQSHIAFIMFSSGTTGLPKGVMITHRNVNARLMTQYNPGLWFESTNSDVLGILPFFHAFGLQMLLGDIFAGKTIHVLEKFDPILYLKSIEKYRISTIVAVPTLLFFLATHPIVDKFDLSCVKDIAYGSSPANLTVLEAVTKRLRVTPRQGYGLTEVTMGIMGVPVGVQRLGSVGLIYHGMSAYIRDPHTGKKLGPHQNGEICLKGDLVMKGYYRNEIATKETFTEDGYLRTGDVGYYDNEEYFYIVDRMKELIKYKSFQVAPAELEAILITHPKIKQAAVVGLPNEKVGELPLALIVKEDNTDLTEDEVKSYLAGFVSQNKHLHGGVVFVDQIPLNSIGKIQRGEVRKMLSKLKSKL